MEPASQYVPPTLSLRATSTRSIPTPAWIAVLALTAVPFPLFLQVIVQALQVPQLPAPSLPRQHQSLRSASVLRSHQQALHCRYFLWKFSVEYAPKLIYILSANYSVVWIRHCLYIGLERDTVPQYRRNQYIGVNQYTHRILFSLAAYLFDQVIDSFIRG